MSGGALPVVRVEAAQRPAIAIATLGRPPVASVTVPGPQGVAGPPGAGGPGAAPAPYAINGAASFTARHGLPYPPEAWIVTSAGEVVETDVFHTPGATTVMFAQPFTGTLFLR